MDEMLYGGDDFEGEWRMFKLLCWVQPLNQFVYLDEIWYGGDDIEGDLDAMSFNILASTIP
jgi:hypothetical protein